VGTMEEAITAIVRYLVIKKLINDVVALVAIKEYLIDGESPSVIAFKYRTSKFKVRGHIQRVIDKAGNYRVATKVVEVVYPHIASIEPVMLRSGGRVLCMLCNTYLRASDAESHLRKKHKEFINNIVRNITNIVISRVRNP
jgi:hypothetical protein